MNADRLAVDTLRRLATALPPLDSMTSNLVELQPMQLPMTSNHHSSICLIYVWEWEYK